ncbi:uncharacterized protein LOC122322420 [Drosophila grimshawi]|uniref:uncharacterized protein LOC122322420 n=1 Tax=Drosophila grimshawi TaxID=7222 RepID=UPI001C936F4F|nr:uncharacterized protein LOC122322420 [Drosophila grimshawi]
MAISALAAYFTDWQTRRSMASMEIRKAAGGWWTAPSRTFSLSGLGGTCNAKCRTEVQKRKEHVTIPTTANVNGYGNGNGNGNGNGIGLDALFLLVQLLLLLLLLLLLRHRDDTSDMQSRTTTSSSSSKLVIIQADSHPKWQIRRHRQAAWVG